MIKDSFIYIIAFFINAFFSFIILPIYTQYLSVEEYGIYGFLLVLNTIFYMLINANLINLLSREFYKSQKKYYYIYSMFLYYLVSFFFLIILLNFIGKYILDFFNINIQIYCLYLIAFISLLKSFVDLYLSILRLRFKAFKFLVVNSILSFCIFITTYLFLNIYGWIGIFLGIGSVYLIATFILFIINWKLFKFDIRFIKEIVFFAINYFPTTMNWRIITLSDRFFITKMLSVSSLGLYTLAFQISSSFNILTSSINQAWTPYFMKHIEDKRTNINKIMIILIVGIGILLFIGFFVLNFIITFFNERYISSLIYIKWFLGVIFLSFIHALVSKYILYYKKEKIISFYTTLGAILNLILNLIFIQFYGGVGAVIATLIVYMFIVSLEILYIVRRNYV